jgi:hypothetical protein
MKAYVYQLFHVSMRGEDTQADAFCGLFTSLPFVREYIAQSNDAPEEFDCYRHPLNPKGAYYVPAPVQIFRK